ncbi:MAG: hypothetical protein NVS3B10_00200 [Polyangiales bacterium]
MQTTPANLNLFFSDMETRLWQSYDVADSFWSKIATLIESGSEQEVYGWTDMVDKMRVWTGSRQVKTPGILTYVVPNMPFELTEGVDKFKIRDDKYGLYFPMAANMGKQAKKLPDYQLRDLIKATGGWSGAQVQLGTDGLAHWGTAHPVDFYDASKGTFCTDFVGGFSVGGINTGGPLAPNAYATLWQEFVSRKSASGEAIGLTPSITALPPQLNITGATILNAQFFAPGALGGLTGNVGATDNMLRGTTDLLMIREFASDPTVWYMLDTTRPIKPFIWQLRQAPFFVYRINEDDPVVFDTHTYLYGIEGRGAPAWAQPFLSARSG